MKNIFSRKSIISFVLVLLIIACPVLMVACGGGNNEKNSNYGKAIGAAIEEIKTKVVQPQMSLLSLDYIEEIKTKVVQPQMSLLSLDYQEIQDGVDESKLVFLDYMKSTGESSEFDFPGKAFEATIFEMDMQGQTYAIYGIHDYVVDGNTASAEMAASYRIGSIESDEIDYHMLTVEYDFENETLISFNWINYSLESDYLFHYVYENGVSKVLMEDESEEFLAFKSQVRIRAEQLFNTEDLAENTYDFTDEYRQVYYDYNGVYPEDLI